MASSVKPAEQLFAVTLKITGRVQGVFYRATACTVAQQLGLVGYVMNNTDGSVRLCAQGTQAQLQHIREWCHQGPPMASVTAVTDLDPMQPISQPSYAQFSVRRA